MCAIYNGAPFPAHVQSSSPSPEVLLDKLADAEATGKFTDEIIKHLIGSVGILVGFSWEQSFDCSVGPGAPRF